MTMHADLQREVERLESRLPSPAGDRDALSRRFENEAGRLAVLADGDEREWLMDELQRMARRYGVALEGSMS